MFWKKTFAVSATLLVLWVLWLFFSVILNQPQLHYTSEPSLTQLTTDAWSMSRPVLPSPQQVLVNFFELTFQTPISSNKSLVYHGWITLSSALLGFVMGLVLGLFLSILILHSQTIEKSIMPWVIASQTVPILSIAPMVVVVLGSIGLVGLVPKSIISAYLSFFPITIGMVKGLKSIDTLKLDLATTYHMSAWDLFWNLRLPMSLPYLFSSMKIAASISLVGAIVGELPTGARSGLGARLLVGSYYGQTVQIWSALLAVSILASLLIAFFSFLEKRVIFWKL